MRDQSRINRYFEDSKNRMLKQLQLGDDSVSIGSDVSNNQRVRSLKLKGAKLSRLFKIGFRKVMQDLRICPKRKKKAFHNKVKTLKGYEGLKIRDSLKTSKLVNFGE